MLNFNSEDLLSDINDTRMDMDKWQEVQRNMRMQTTSDINHFPSADSLLADFSESGTTARRDMLPRNGQQPIVINEAQDTFFETALKAPGIMMDTCMEASGMKMTQEIVTSLLQNPEFMRMAMVAVQAALLA